MIDWKLKLAALPGALLGVIMGFPPLFNALLALMALDFVTGFLIAWSTGVVSSDASRRGFVKKAVTLLLITGAAVLQHAYPIGVDLAALLCGAFAVSEFISIAENCGKAGVSLPPWLMRALAQLRERSENEAPNK